MTPHEWIIKQLAMKYSLPAKDVKAVVHHNFKTMHDAFGKEEVTSMEWVGIGKFVVSQGRLKYYIAKIMSKIYHGEEIMKTSPTDRLAGNIKTAKEKIETLKTKIKDDEVIEYLRGVEEQLASKFNVERRYFRDSD